jgi:hypothetical protein
MTVQEIVDKVIAERQTPGRFPSRLIFVNNFSNYSLLVDELSKVCDVILNLASFAQGDILPNFNALKRELGKHSNKQILLLSMGEYLRICLKREVNRETSVFPGIWAAMQPEQSTTKYIIPIFGGRELFDQAVPFIDERQKDFLWDIRGSTEQLEYKVSVYSKAFATAVKPDAANFQEWLKNWDSLYADQVREDFSVISKLVKYTIPTVGNVSTKVVDEPFSYVASLVSDGQKLRREWGDESFWVDVSKNVVPGDRFEATVKFILNMGLYFDISAALARYDHLSGTERNLLLAWYRLYPTDDYYSFAIRKATHSDDIPIMLRDAIFELPKVTDANLSERQKALKILSVQYGHEYFLKLDKVLPAEMRLSYLTYKTLEERAYAVKTVSSLLRTGVDIHVIAEQLSSDFPDLAEYLVPSNGSDDEVARYFKWYRLSKIKNRPSEDWLNIDLETFDSRNKILQQHNAGTLTFWVDGLGIEWLPLLVKKLKQLKIAATVKPIIGRAIIPTETEYNRAWKDEDEKWDRLDKLSHNGMPDDRDYFLCIARQIEIIGEVVARTSELLAQNDRVIITGDHGSSRLAALMFHAPSNFAIDPPTDSIVRSFGRFCELSGNVDIPLTDSMELTIMDGKEFIVMKTYEHFKQSGNAAGGNLDDKAVAGEVHGGMTPEEYLVPVILVTRKVSSDPIKVNKKLKAAEFNDMGI